MKLKFITNTGEISSHTAADAVFGLKVNAALVAQAVRVYLANQRQATAKTKTRSEINRTTKKWYKQKHTGNARHGARSPSIFVGGGVAFGPNSTQNFALKMSKQMSRAAMRAVFSMQREAIVLNEEIMLLDGKTAQAAKLLKKVIGSGSGRILVVLSKAAPEVVRSLHNLPMVVVTTAQRLNVFQVAVADHIVMTKESVKMIEDRLVAASKVESEVETVKSVKPAKSEVKSAEVKTKVAKSVKSVEAKAKPAVKKTAVAAKATTKAKTVKVANKK